MNRRLLNFFAVIGMAAFVAGPSAKADAPSNNWVCQNLLLKGDASEPLPKGVGKNLLLTLSYQLDYNEDPVVFLTNHPLSDTHFEILLTGERKRAGEKDAYFLPKLFLLPREIEFFYYLQSADRTWVSDLKRTKFSTERITDATQLNCQVELSLEPMALKPQSH